MVFHPTPLPVDVVYSFNYPHQELFFTMADSVQLNGLLFKANQSKGLVFYFHGNSGNLKKWGEIADLYLENNYDFFIFDYRSFGKSGGKIKKEKELYSDNQTVYNSILSQFNYAEKDIIVIGYSIGTCFASKIAAENTPKSLILKAPYYSIPNLINQKYKAVPHFLVKYKLPTYKYLAKVKGKVTIFHGDEDPLIPIKSSYKLQKLFKENDTLIVLPGNNHRKFEANPIYKNGIKRVLNN